MEALEYHIRRAKHVNRARLFRTIPNVPRIVIRNEQILLARYRAAYYNLPPDKVERVLRRNDEIVNMIKASVHFK
jgi:hypothetical protein